VASNITVSNLVVAPGIQHNFAQWTVDDPNTLGLPYKQLKAVELWASATNNRDSATKVAEGITSAGYVYSGFAKRYHWIRARDQEGEYGEWYPSSSIGGAVASSVWQAYTPELRPGAGSFNEYNVIYARYMKIGSVVTFNGYFYVDNGTGSLYVEIDLPVRAANAAVATGTGGGNGDALVGVISAAGQVCRVNKYDGDYVSNALFNILISGQYEASE
jgi:hypothetical protein